MPGRKRRWIARIGSRIVREIAAAALLASVLTVVIQNLPKIDLLQAAVNDDNFTDLVLKTRGELPIDTNIRILTYDASILDTFDMVDRQALALRLAALFEMKPRIVGVDFLIETERPEAPDGDAMLAALIGDHPNLLFGVFHEDSLGRFRLPPAIFKLGAAQLGCINLQADDDNTMRTYQPVWGNDTGRQFESFDVKIARAIDSPAVSYLRSFGDGNFTIDYAAGIGETRSGNGRGDQIFPTIPLDAVFDAVSSGDPARIAPFRDMLAGKAVLVGYGDLRPGQVTSVVDRFYTPFKPEKNTLPDMHGIAIHANIINTILHRRVLQAMPLAANILWSSLLVAVLLAGRERLRRIRRPTRRAVATYAGFALLFVTAALLPVAAFSYTPFKFSIFMPIAALLLAVPTLEGLRTGVNLLQDMRRRLRLRRALPPRMRAAMATILRAWSPEERLERAIHFLEREFHTCAAVIFDEAAHGTIDPLPAAAHAAPTLARLRAAVDWTAVAARSPRLGRAIALLRAMQDDPVLERTLRLSRSLYIAVNEIRRQSAEDLEEINADNAARAEMAENVAGYADLALKALSAQGENDDERFDELYAALERYAAHAGSLLRTEQGAVADLIGGEGLPPYVRDCVCRLHGTTEPFVYFGEQEDANDRDDLFDLVYIGATIRCQPTEHPGLSRFREMTSAAWRAPED